MERIVKQGQLLFAVAVTAFGVENLICARIGQAALPIPWLPESSILAYLTGIAFLAAGLSIATNIRARPAAILLGILFLLFDLLLQAPLVAAKPMSVSIRTTALETLAMCGSALTLAGTLPAGQRNSPRLGNALDKLIASGPLLFAMSSVVFGIDHFLVPGIIAGLVPAWIPGALFWAYFFGAAFIGAGVSIATRWMAPWAAFLLGAMFLLWVLVLHGPRVMSARGWHNPDEWSSAFIALGMGGGSWICAWHALQRRRRNAASEEQP